MSKAGRREAARGLPAGWYSSVTVRVRRRRGTSPAAPVATPASHQPHRPLLAQTMRRLPSPDPPQPVQLHRQPPGAVLQVLQVAEAVERPAVDAARPAAGSTACPPEGASRAPSMDRSRETLPEARLHHSAETDQSAAVFALSDVGCPSGASLADGLRRGNHRPDHSAEGKQGKPLGVADLWSWSPRSDWNRRPSDYESDRNRPAGLVRDHRGCSGAGTISSSAVAWCSVVAPGLPERLPPCCGGAARLPHPSASTIRSRAEGRSFGALPYSSTGRARDLLYRAQLG
jgi:hypothetical protein